MGKIHKEWNKDLNQWVYWDEQKDIHNISAEEGKERIKSGRLGRAAQYKYF